MQLPRDPADNQPWSPRWGRELLRYIKSITPQSSTNILVRQNPGGTTFQPTVKQAKARRGGVSTPAKYHPFQIINTSTIANPQVQVTDGSLMNAFSAYSSEVIENLETNISVTVDSLIYMYYDSDTLDITITAERRSSLSEWTDYPDVVSLTGSAPSYEQTKWYQLVGYVSTTIPSDTDHQPGFLIDINETDHWVNQTLFTHNMLQSACYNGSPILYPYPWYGKGPI